MGGSAARVTAGPQELARVDGERDTGVTAVLSLAGDGEELDNCVEGVLPFPPDEFSLPAPGHLALAPDAEAPLSPFSLTYRGGSVQHGPSCS
jgi:hypothetical protein